MDNGRHHEFQVSGMPCEAIVDNHGCVGDAEAMLRGFYRDFIIEWHADCRVYHR